MISQPAGKTERPYNISIVILWLCVVLYIVIFSVLSIKRYLAFNCDLDFGNILQAFYNTLHGHFMQMTWFGQDITICRWVGHTEVIFTLLIPVFALFKHPYTLLILQTIAIAVGGIAVYRIALFRSGDERFSLVLALTYLLFPYLASINLSDIHSDPFMILPHLLAWYFLISGKPKRFWIAIAIGTLCKEYVCIFNLLLGIMVIRDHRNKGIALTGLALAQYFVMTPLIGVLCGSPLQFIRTESHALVVPASAATGSLFAAAGKVLSLALTKDTFFKALSLVLILNIALLRFSAGLVLLLPLFGALLALDQHGLFINHRHAMIIAPVFIVLIEGLARLKPEKRFRHALVFTLLPTILITFGYPGSLIGKNLSEMFLHPEYRNVFHYHYTPHDRLLDSLIAKIPPQVSIAAENNIRTKLADREWAFMHPYPDDIAKADYYLFDFFETRDFRQPMEKRLRFGMLAVSGKLSFESFLDGIVILRKDSTAGERPYLFNQATDFPLPDTVKGLGILSAQTVPVEGGYISTCDIAKGPDSAKGDALISLFISGADTLRVLHLPSYTLADFRKLSSGIYQEVFFFQIPYGKTLEGRTRIIALYKKDAYLPFFARPSYLIKILYHD